MEPDFRGLIENLRDIIYTADLNGMVTYVNPAVEVVLGYPPSEIVGRFIFDFVHREDAEKARGQLANLAANDLGWGEYRILSKRGEVRWVRSSCRPIYNGAGLIGVQGVLADITAHKLMQQKMQEQFHFLQTLMDAVPIPIFFKDCDGVYLGCNKAFGDFTGRSQKEIVGKTVYDVWPRELADVYYKADNGLFQSKGTQIYESSILHADDSPHDVVFHKAAFSGPDGHIAGLIGSCIDISERKQAEIALRESRGVLRTIIDANPEALFLLDTEGQVIDANETLAKRFNKTVPEIVGTSIFDVMSGEVLLERRKILKELVRTGQLKQNEDQRDGRDLENYYHPILNAEGKVEKIAVLSRDITEYRRAEAARRQLEDRLRRAEKMEALGIMAGGVAHDLNNALGILVGYAELLLYDIPKESPLREHAQNIMQGGERAAAVVQDLLILARRGVQSKKMVNLNLIIQQYLESPEFIHLSGSHSRVRLKTQLDTNLLNISGSSVHLFKTLENLVMNAAEAMPDGGLLTIRTENRYLDRPITGYDDIREGDYVLLTISDTGIGIPPQDINHIFEPFYTRKFLGRSGTGLGLAVVWGTVKDLGGYINIKSERGRGTTFALYFPIRREDLSMDQTAISEYMGKGETILIVDDVKEQRELAARMLFRLNYQVASVASGEEAVQYLKMGRADVIILDMVMDPGMDGLDTYKKILEIHPRQRAIMVSGFSETDRVTEAQALGAGAYVNKPYVMERLALAVRQELDRPL